MIQPLREPFEHKLSQKRPINSLFKRTLGLISARGSKSALGNWTVPLANGAKLDPILYFTHLNGPIFRAKTDLFYLQCVRTTTTITAAAHRLAYGLATS